MQSCQNVEKGPFAGNDGSAQTLLCTLTLEPPGTRKLPSPRLHGGEGSVHGRLVVLNRCQ